MKIFQSFPGALIQAIHIGMTADMDTLAATAEADA